MNKETFWKIMLETNKASGGEPLTQQGLIEIKLDELLGDEIIEFDKIYRELLNDAYDWKLWAAAFIVNGGCSDDCFMDFRGWLIAQGEEIYTKALANPDSLSEIDNLYGDCEWEGFGYLSFTVYEKKTGKEMQISPEINYPSEPKGEEWDENELDNLLPKLSQKRGC
ncbi:MAG: DUF4240 domain-containing protein [Saprospiraceae bacterium]|nr:DUF4240 domain-containing protein [Saprospiraceae bacterium]